ncbi:MAG: serine hydrolase domain-containing protein [Candidatus Hodarchaeota archaeon]
MRLIVVFAFFIVFLPILLPFQIQTHSSVNTNPPPAAITVASHSEKSPIVSMALPVQLNESYLAIFWDEIIPNHLAEDNVAGVTISVVNASGVLFAKGYGYANVAKGTLVTANETLFNIASISKVFTATAVMKLVENGTLDLNTDVNNYLESFQVPMMPGAGPITLAHLLSHTAGFEESLEDIFISDIDSLPTIGEFLEEYLPARVFPPGYVQGYSNLGSALAGFVVEEVMGVSFGEFVEDHVLKPLGMNSTTAYQQVPSSLAPRHSRGYSNFNGELVSNPHYYCAVPPAGGMSSTAQDMAQIMLMYLNEGSYAGEQFLEETTVQQMQAEQVIGHPELTGIGYGFYRRKMNNQTLVGHTGGMPGFSGIMALLPEHEIGIFIAVNTDSGSYGELLTAFIDRYFPTSLEPVEALPTTSDRLTQFEGYYLPTRREYVNLSPFLISLYADLITHITVLPDFSLLVRTNYLPIDGMSFVEVDDLLFRDKTGQTDICIGFREEGPGNVTFMFLSLSSLTAMEKINSWYLNVTGLATQEFERESTFKRLYWSVNAFDWQEKNYTLYRNGTSVATGNWSIDTSIIYNLGDLEVGTYNFTLVVEDTLGDQAADTVMVHITSDVSHTAESSTSVSESSMSIIGILLSILGLSLVRRKRLARLH